MTRISFNVNALRLGDSNYFMSVMRRLLPTTALIMDDWGVANRVHDQNGGQTKVVYRSTQQEGVLHWQQISPTDYVNEIIKGGNPHIYRYILNEPVAREQTLTRLLNWLIEVMDRLADAGYKGVFGNWPAAIFEQAEIEAGVYDNYLRALNRHRGRHSGGWHDYVPMLFAFGAGFWPNEFLLDPTKLQPNQWPTDMPVKRIDGRLPSYWYMMRESWFDIRSQELGLNPPDKWITEYGWDRMPNLATDNPNNIYNQVQRKWGKPGQYKVLWGVYTMTEVYKAWFPNWNFSQSMVEQLKWADGIYPASYTGFNLFTWSEGAPDWDTERGFNFSRDRQTHEYLIAYAAEQRAKPTTPPVVTPPVVTPPVVTPPVVIPPVVTPPVVTPPVVTPPSPYPDFPRMDEPDWLEISVSSSAGATRMRKTPTIQADNINGAFGRNVAAYILKSKATSQVDGRWFPVRIKGTSLWGWVREDVFTIREQAIERQFAISVTSTQDQFNVFKQRVTELLDELGLYTPVG